MTSSTDPVETELKFSLGPGARRALETGLLRDAKTSELSATYFDTPDLALFAHGYGLRVRRRGDRFVQTLKSTGDGLFARGEWETEVASTQLDAAAFAATPAATVAAVEMLAPLFTVDVRRTAAVVRHGGSTIEASLDVGEVRARRRGEAVEELELELVKGHPRDLFALARTLEAPLVLAFVTKSERGYRLACGVAPKSDGPHSLLRRLSAAIIEKDAALAATAASQLGIADGEDANLDLPAWAGLLLDAAERLSVTDTPV